MHAKNNEMFIFLLLKIATHFLTYGRKKGKMFVSSDRSSCTDDGLLYISRPLFQIFTQSVDAIDVTSATLSHLNSMNAIDAIYAD